MTDPLIPTSVTGNGLPQEAPSLKSRTLFLTRADVGVEEIADFNPEQIPALRDHIRSLADRSDWLQIYCAVISNRQNIFSHHNGKQDHPSKVAPSILEATDVAFDAYKNRWPDSETEEASDES